MPRISRAVIKGFPQNSNRNLETILSQDCHLVRQTREYLEKEDDKVMIDEVRSITRIGRHGGDDSFVGRIAGLLGREPRALPGGRPRKNK